MVGWRARGCRLCWLLTDIFDRIITAPSESGQVEAKGAAKQAVVNSVVQFTGVPRARSCYFDYEHDGEEKRLVCRIYAGRDAKPRTQFSSADPRHLEVFKLLHEKEMLLFAQLLGIALAGGGRHRTR